MAGGPSPIAQYPRLNFPGGEFYNLAPGTKVALGARLSRRTVSAPIAVPASGQGQGIADVTVLQTATHSSGVYLVRAYVLFNPVDPQQKLQISAARLGLGSGAGAIVFDVGFPAATLSSPQIALVAIFDRDLLITEQDLELNISGPFFQPNTPMILSGLVNATNTDAVNQHSFTVQTSCIWHQLDGIVT